MTDSNSKKSVLQLQKIVIDALEDVKAQNISVFNTEKLSPLFERVIIASGTSNRQTKALAASVRDEVREAGYGKSRVEGEENGEWIIVDCGSVVAHIMQPAIREYYHLEEIWGEKPVRFKHGEDKMSELVKERVMKPQAEQNSSKSTKATKASKATKATKATTATKASKVANVANSKSTSGDQAKTAPKKSRSLAHSSALESFPSVEAKKTSAKAAKKVSPKLASSTNSKTASDKDGSRKKSASASPAKPTLSPKTKESSTGLKTAGKATASSKSLKPRSSNGAPVPAKKPRNSPPRA